MQSSSIRRFFSPAKRIFPALFIMAVTLSCSFAAYADEKSGNSGRSENTRYWHAHPYVTTPPPVNHVSPVYSIDAGSLARISIMVEGERAPIYYHRGTYYAQGREGAKYSLLIVNRYGGRIKAVCSVDGLDIIDGRSANSFDRSGYVIGSYSSANIRGWRISDGEVATFRFGPISESYAMKMDRPSDIGIMKFGFFRERVYDDYIAYPSYDGRKFVEERRMNQGSSARPAHSPNASESKERSDSTFSAAPSIGTEFGENRRSSVRRTEFVENTRDPEEIVSLRYATYDDLVRMGVFGGDYEINRRDVEQREKRGSDYYCPPPTDWRK